MLALFRVQVSANAGLLAGLRPLLLADELLRASRYRRVADHNRFLLARAVLRGLLGHHSGQDPRAIRFASGLNNKPAAVGLPTVHFNVSHAHDWILLALAATAIGVDVEKIDPHLPLVDILPHSFSPPEQAFIGRSAARRPAFYQAWTRKEAFAKATAQGIAADFSQLPSLDGPHYLAAAVGPVVEWCISSFAVAAEYPAAVAYPASIRPAQLRFYDFDASPLVG